MAGSPVGPGVPAANTLLSAQQLEEARQALVALWSEQGVTVPVNKAALTQLIAFLDAQVLEAEEQALAVQPIITRNWIKGQTELYLVRDLLEEIYNTRRRVLP